MDTQLAVPAGSTQGSGASRDSGVTQPADSSTKICYNLCSKQHELLQIVLLTPRTKLIAQALQARQKALRRHNMEQQAIPTSEMMHEIVSSLRKQFAAEHRKTFCETLQLRREYAVDNAFNTYVFQASLTAEGHQYDDDDELYELYGPDIEIHRVVQLWESIRTNNISSQDRRNVK